jgi:hypothetical protein
MAINKAAIVSLNSAANFTEEFRIVYAQLKQIQTKINLYAGGSDAIFNAAINATIGSAERSQITAMKPGIDAIISSWETNYAGIIAPA